MIDENLQSNQNNIKKSLDIKFFKKMILENHIVAF
jgi:hypothetical protein